MTPKARAETVTATMMEHDKASNWLGIQVQTSDEGRAVLTLEVKDHHLNGHSICHGGFIFTLADSAFAFACNSYNQNAVAQTNDITFVAPGKLGDVLTATCEEQSKTGRSGIYDAKVTNQNGETIALMRGRSRTIKGTHFEEDTP